MLGAAGVGDAVSTSSASLLRPQHPQREREGGEGRERGRERERRVNSTGLGIASFLTHLTFKRKTSCHYHKWKTTISYPK